MPMGHVVHQELVAEKAVSSGLPFSIKELMAFLQPAILLRVVVTSTKNIVIPIFH